jgi:hypothetical protein
MVRTKDKKAKGDDAFKDKKQKVGRKKLAPSTATRAEVHSRSLRVDVQRAVAVEQQRQKDASAAAGSQASPTAAGPSSGASPGAEEAAAASAAEQPRLIAEALVNVVHYRAGSRKGALQACLRWLSHRANRLGLESPVRTVQVLERALNTLTDTDGDVRVASREVVAFIASKTFPANPAMVPAVAGLMLRHINIALTHAEKDVRCGTLDVVGKVLVPEEAWWLEGHDDAHERASFARYLAHEVPETHEELLRMAEASATIAKQTKNYAALSAVLRALVAPVSDEATGHTARSPLADSPRLHAILSDLVHHCCSLFKELMEMRQALFGLRDKFNLAVSMAHCLGVLLRYLAAPAANQNAAQQHLPAHRQLLRLPLNRSQMQQLRAAFIDSVQFSLAELTQRGSLNGLRLAMAVGAIATPLLRCGLASVTKAVVSVCLGLLASENLAVCTFAIQGISALLEARLASDVDAQQLCRAAAATLVGAVPTTVQAVLKTATAATSVRSRGQILYCLRVLEDAFDAGLFALGASADLKLHEASDEDDDDAKEAKKEAPPAQPPKDVVIAAPLVKALFMGRETALADSDVDIVVKRTLALLTKFATSRRHALCAADTQQLKSAVGSLFGIPGKEGTLMPGIVTRCVPATSFAAAAVVWYAGGAVPEEWASDPRMAAAMAAGLMP